MRLVFLLLFVSQQLLTSTWAELERRRLPLRAGGYDACPGQHWVGDWCATRRGDTDDTPPPMDWFEICWRPLPRPRRSWLGGRRDHRHREWQRTWPYALLHGLITLLNMRLTREEIELYNSDRIPYGPGHVYWNQKRCPWPRYCQQYKDQDDDPRSTCRDPELDPQEEESEHSSDDGDDDDDDESSSDRDSDREPWDSDYSGTSDHLDSARWAFYSSTTHGYDSDNTPPSPGAMPTRPYPGSTRTIKSYMTVDHDMPAAALTASLVSADHKHMIRSVSPIIGTVNGDYNPGHFLCESRSDAHDACQSDHTHDFHKGDRVELHFALNLADLASRHIEQVAMDVTLIRPATVAKHV